MLMAHSEYNCSGTEMHLIFSYENFSHLKISTVCKHVFVVPVRVPCAPGRLEQRKRTSSGIKGTRDVFVSYLLV